MPGAAYNSIQNPRMYEALRRRGYSKEAAARITNARTKARTRIVGNLFRGEGGRFTGGEGGGEAAPAKPDKAAERQAERQAARDAAMADEDALRAREDAAVDAEPNAKKRAAMRRANALARRKRSAERRAATRAEREQERGQREAERAAAAAKPKPEPKKGGGGGGKAKPSEDEKRQAALQKRRDTARTTAPQVGLSPAEADFLHGVATGTQPPGSFDAKRLTEMGLVADAGDTTEPTPAGRKALAALERGDVGAFRAAVQEAAGRRAADARRQAERRTRDAEDAAEDTTRAREDAATDAAADPKARSALRRQIVAARRARLRARRAARRQRRAAKSVFAVFKDARGRDRWVSVTTTAYQDKDREWISRKAIAGAVAAGDAGQPRGVLRYWHVPGLDFGDCDYQAAAQGGRFLIESGTCASPRHAAVVRTAAAKGYQMSPGFFHPRTEPRAGVFDHIVIFERSFVPPGRASNPWTRLLVKETRMLTDEKQKEFAALAGDQEGREFLTGLLATVAATDKAAGAAAVYKDAPAWAQDLARRLDALEAAKAPMPPEEMVEAGATEVEDGMGEMAEPELDDGPLLGEADIAAIAQAVVAAIGPALDLEKKMAGYLNEMKGMLAPASAAKDDAVALLAAQVAELRGDMPRAAKEAAAVAGQAMLPAGFTSPTDQQPDPLAAFLGGFQFGGAARNGVTPGGN